MFCLPEIIWRELQPRSQEKKCSLINREINLKFHVMQKLVKNNKKPSDREKKECRKWLNSIHNFYELDISIKGNKY